MACPKVLTESPMTIQRPLQRCHHTASLKWISLLPLDPTIFSCSIHSKGCKPAKLDGNKKNQNGEIRFLTAVERRGHVNHTMGAYNRMQAGTLIQSSTHFHSHLLSTAKKKIDTALLMTAINTRFLSPPPRARENRENLNNSDVCARHFLIPLD